VIRWLTLEEVLYLHSETLREHGGRAGVRDQGLLESAIARPRNLHACEGVLDLCPLAAAYACGISCNHPFLDGNKRTAFSALGVFLMLNRARLTASEAEAAVVMLELAAGALEERTLAAWLREHVREV